MATTTTTILGRLRRKKKRSHYLTLVVETQDVASSASSTAVNERQPTDDAGDDSNADAAVAADTPIYVHVHVMDRQSTNKRVADHLFLHADVRIWYESVTVRTVDDALATATMTAAAAAEYLAASTTATSAHIKNKNDDHESSYVMNIVRQVEFVRCPSDPTAIEFLLRNHQCRQDDDEVEQEGAEQEEGDDAMRNNNKVVLMPLHLERVLEASAEEIRSIQTLVDASGRRKQKAIQCLVRRLAGLPDTRAAPKQRKITIRKKDRELVDRLEQIGMMKISDEATGASTTGEAATTATAPSWRLRQPILTTRQSLGLAAPVSRCVTDDDGDNDENQKQLHSRRLNLPHQTTATTTTASIPPHPTATGSSIVRITKQTTGDSNIYDDGHNKDQQQRHQQQPQYDEDDHQRRILYLHKKKQPQIDWIIARIRHAMMRQQQQQERQDPLSATKTATSTTTTTILDVGGGRGDLAVAMALAFQEEQTDNDSNSIKIVVVDRNESSLLAGQAYAKQMGLDDDQIEFVCADFLDFVTTNKNKNNKFKLDWVVALHACGDLSDLAIQYAVSGGGGGGDGAAANFLICPCCYTKRFFFRHANKNDDQRRLHANGAQQSSTTATTTTTTSVTTTSEDDVVAAIGGGGEEEEPKQPDRVTGQLNGFSKTGLGDSIWWHRHIHACACCPPQDEASNESVMGRCKEAKKTITSLCRLAETENNAKSCHTIHKRAQIIINSMRLSSSCARTANTFSPTSAEPLLGTTPRTGETADPTANYSYLAIEEYEESYSARNMVLVGLRG